MFRIAKRDDLVGWKRILVRLGSVAVGIFLAGILIALLGYDPIATFSVLLGSAFSSGSSWVNTLAIAIPLMITALGLSVAFRMKFWNIGGEGQLIMGAIFATFVAHRLPAIPADMLTQIQIGDFLIAIQTGAILQVVFVILMALAGFFGGALWAFIPGFFRVFFRTNETLFTLMMNYIALAIVSYLHFVLWRDPEAKGFPKIKAIPNELRLPSLFGVQIGWIIALGVALFIFLLIRKTKLGYEIRVVGESAPTAHYAGMNVKKVMLTGVIISGGIVGLAGMVKLSGSVFTLSPSITGGAGFSAIIVAWLANLSAPFIAIVSLLIAALEQGSQVIQIKLSIPSAIGNIIQGLILMSTLGGEFFLRYRFVPREKSSQTPISLEKGSEK